MVFKKAQILCPVSNTLVTSCNDKNCFMNKSGFICPAYRSL